MKRMLFLLVVFSISISAFAQTKMFINKSTGTDSVWLSDVKSISFKTYISTGTSGTVSFNSDKGNFSANGIYNPSATTGSGAGGFLMTSSGSNILAIYAYRFNSITSLDLAIIEFMDTAPIAAGTFTYPSTSSKSVLISYFPALNLNDTTSSFYLLMTSTTATISALSSSNAQGTFSGNGMYFVNGTPNPSQTITVTGGSFNVPVTVGSGGTIKQANSKIEGIVRRIVNSSKR